MPSRWEINELRLRKRLARNVRQLRQSRGLSMEDAAQEIMSWRQWQRIESGDHSSTLRTVAKLADALDVDPVELLAQ